MTTNGTGTPDYPGTGEEGLKEKASDAAAEVGAGAKDVAGVAKDEASHVVDETKSAARGLLADARTQLTDQASTQKQRAADGLRTVGSQFSSMAEGSESGAASNLVRTLSRRADSAANWLTDREPADIVQDVRGFARRNTGLFLAIAAGVGVVAGRVARALREGEPAADTSASGRRYGTTSTATPLYDATAVASGGASTGYSAGTGEPVYGQPATSEAASGDAWAAPVPQGDRP